MTNYKNIIQKFQNNSIILKNKTNTKNKILNSNSKIQLLYKNTTQIISNKNLTKIIKFSINKQIFIIVKGLNVINKHLNKIILSWIGSKTNLFEFINNSKNKTKIKNLLPLTKINKNNIKPANNINKLKNNSFTIKKQNLNVNDNKIIPTKLEKLNVKNNNYNKVIITNLENLNNPIDTLLKDFFKIKEENLKNTTKENLDKISINNKNSKNNHKKIIIKNNKVEFNNNNLTINKLPLIKKTNSILKNNNLLVKKFSSLDSNNINHNKKKNIIIKRQKIQNLNELKISLIKKLYLLKKFFLLKNNKKNLKNIKFSLINTNLVNTNFITKQKVRPLMTINSKNYKNSKLNKNFSDYKLLLLLNKQNNYKSINSIRNFIKNITNFNSNSAYSFLNNYNYKFNNSNRTKNKITKNLYIFLESFFYSMYYLISKPIFIITPNKVVIHIFAFNFLIVRTKRKKWNKKFFFKCNRKIFIKDYIKEQKPIFNIKNNLIKFKIVSQLLARYFRKPVEFDIVKLNNPYHNSNILVKILGFIVNNTKLRIIKTNIFRKAKIIRSKLLSNKNKYNNKLIPSYISGINIKVAGRLLTQRVIPRRTVKIFSKGSIARGKIFYLETARFTNKNKRGAFSITISTGHIKY